MQINEQSPASIAPNGSQDIPSQSQEFEQYGRRHFVDFLASMTSQTNAARHWKMKVQYLMSLLFDLFEILQAVRSEQTNFAWL